MDQEICRYLGRTSTWSYGESGLSHPIPSHPWQPTQPYYQHDLTTTSHSTHFHLLPRSTPLTHSTAEISDLERKHDSLGKYLTKEIKAYVPMFQLPRGLEATYGVGTYLSYLPRYLIQSEMFSLSFLVRLNGTRHSIGTYLLFAKIVIQFQSQNTLKLQAKFTKLHTYNKECLLILPSI